MNNSEKKVLRVIKYNESYIKEQEQKGIKTTYKKPSGFIGFTTLFFDKINLKLFREMLGQDKRKLRPELKELYRAI